MTTGSSGPRRIKGPKSRKLTTDAIWVGDYFTNGAPVIREVTGVWSGNNVATTLEIQKDRVDGHNFRVDYVAYRQWKVNLNGTFEPKPRYGRCGARTFIRWVTRPPIRKTKKCSHCNGTGRV